MFMKCVNQTIEHILMLPVQEHSSMVIRQALRLSAEHIVFCHTHGFLTLFCIIVQLKICGCLFWARFWVEA